MIDKRMIILVIGSLFPWFGVSALGAKTVLFRDDFTAYPGTEWATYTSNPANANYKAEIVPSTNLLYTGFGTEGVANAAVLVAGQNAYASPKVHSGADYVSYAYNFNQITGLYTGVDLYVSDQKMDDSVSVARNMAPPGGNYFRLRLKRNSSTELNLSLFAGGGYLGYVLVDVTGLNDPGNSKELSIRLNDTTFAVYDGASQLASVNHGVDLSAASDTAYMSMVQHTQYDSGGGSIYSYIDYAEISSTVPEPITLILLGIGTLGLVKRRR